MNKKLLPLPIEREKKKYFDQFDNWIYSRTLYITSLGANMSKMRHDKFQQCTKI